MAEKRIVRFQSKKVKICRFFFHISNNYYIYLKIYFEKNVTNDFISIFWRSAALSMSNLRYRTLHPRLLFAQLVLSKMLFFV